MSSEETITKETIIKDNNNNAIIDKNKKFLDKVELFYLNALRIFTLLIASILLLCALGFGIFGLYKILQSPDSVTEKPSTVSVSELMNLNTAKGNQEVDSPEQDNSESANPNKDEYKIYYKDYVSRYYKLFQDVYVKYKRPEDKNITLKEFDEMFVDSASRIENVDNSTFAQDKKDLEDYFAVISKLSISKENFEKLIKYKAAEYISTTRKINDTKTVKSCAEYFYYDNSCLYYETKQVPIVRTVTEKHLPDGITGYASLLSKYQDEYFTILEEKREANKGEAQAKRDRIAAGKASAGSNFTIALGITGGFMILMFFFLLIAIERHQRIISVKLGISKNKENS